MSNEQTVKEVYEAFQRGDVSAIQTRVTDDVDWRNDAVESRECHVISSFGEVSPIPHAVPARAKRVGDDSGGSRQGAKIPPILRIQVRVR
jgi:hypothetical protein